MKKKEELNDLKETAEALEKKLDELNEEELVQIFGGSIGSVKQELKNLLTKIDLSEIDDWVCSDYWDN